MREDWPTAAAACFSGMERGPRESPRRAEPATMAPEVTRATSRRSATRAAMSVARAPRRLPSRPSPGLVIRPLPTLTTSRRALVSAGSALETGIEIHEMHDHAGALGVTEKPDAQTLPLGGARDEPREVGDHEGAVLVHAHDAQRRLQRGERVVGDLGLGRRQPGHER